MNFKKLFTFLMTLVLGFSLIGCDKDEPDTPPHTHSYVDGVCECGDVEEPAKPSNVDVEIDAKFSEIGLNTPVYLTTVGQADIDNIANVIYDLGSADEIDIQLGETPTAATINIVQDNLLNASDVAEDGKKPLVLLVTGTSGKGLGDAGTDVAGETARAAAFAAAAEAGEINLVVFHIGGEGRRGSQSDPVLDAVCGSATMLLVVETGNFDNYFTEVSVDSNVPLYLYSRTSKIGTALKTIFGF